ncbi:MAG: DUF1634 domain-containing protein [Chloroflexota bacterium]
MTTSLAAAQIEATVEQRIARLLNVGTLVAIVLVLIGVVMMLIQGIDPLQATGATDPRATLSLLAAGNPAGLIWLGTFVVVSLPIARVLVALVGFVREGDRPMALIAVAIVAVIALSIAIASTVEV